MEINNKYNFGDRVYLKTDPEQLERMVTGIIVVSKTHFQYYVSYITNESRHYQCELTDNIDIVKKLNS